MTRRMAILLLLLLCAAGCSDSPTTPATANVAGVWTGTLQLATVAGGECVGATLLQTQTGPTSVTASITQTGVNLTATVTSQASGLSCSYTGTAGEKAFTLTATFCQIATITGFHCSNGAVRDWQLTGGSVTASLNGNTATGTSADTYNIRVSGTTTGVGILSLTSNFSIQRQ